MDEASGDIVDEVETITLADTGTPTYSVEDGDYGAGITIEGSDGFEIGSEQSAMAIGTGSVTITWYATKNTMAQSPETIFSQDTDTLDDGIRCDWTTSAFPRIQCTLYASQWVYSTCIWNDATTNNIPGDSTEHLYVLTIDRNGDMGLTIDGSEPSKGPGTCATTDTSGHDVGAPGFYLGNSGGGANAYGGTIFWWKEHLGL